MAISEIRKPLPSEALEKALGGLDASCRQAMAYHLKQRSQIDIASELTISQIEDAMCELFDESATLFLSRLYTELSQDIQVR